MVSLINQKEKKRFIKFALVGVSGTIVDFGVFNILTLFFNHMGINIIFNFEAVIFASILSFIIAVFNNYYWNRNWTYPESKQFSHTDQLIKFGTVSVGGLLIRTPLFAWIMEPVIDIVSASLTYNFFMSPEVLGQNIALGLVVVIVLFWNYFINRIWTYRKI